MSTTPYLELDDQATGANDNTWGDVADANFAIIEQAIARLGSISTTGGTTTLTSSQNRFPVIRLTGTLASNAVIQVKTQEKNWIFINATTGAYSVTVKTAAGTGKTLPRGRAVKLYCDGTNVEYARERGIPSAQAGGTVDAITATFEPATTAAELQDGTLWIVEAAGANTSTTPTFNPDGTGNLTIKKNGGQALILGDIRAAGHKLLLCYDASGGHAELLNPSMVATLAGYAPLDSPAFTNTPTAPTQAAYDETTKLATTAQVAATVKSVPENPQTGTAYSLALSDVGKLVSLTNAGAITLTVTKNATVSWPAFARIDLGQGGAGQVTVVPDTGVTIRSAAAKTKLSGQYSGATLWRQSSDVWWLFGDLA